MKIGAHVPVLGNYIKMFEYSQSVGCECAQIFAKNAKQYRYSAPSEARLSQMRKVKATDPHFDVNSHTAYLINLSTSNDEIREKSIEAMAGELAIAAMFGLSSVNTHVGNDPDSDVHAAAERAANSLAACHARTQEILKQWCLEDGLVPCAPLNVDGIPAIPTLLLEGAAGAGKIFGVTVNELARIIDATLSRGAFVSSIENDAKEHDNGIGICIDTCHIWAAGYDVSCEAGWNELLDEIDGSIGIERLRLIHANDSKFERGTHKDRHEWIGNGKIGIDGFSYMMKCPRISHANVVLEIPGEAPEKDIVNIALLKQLRTPSPRPQSI